nr:uncharacterized protein LOC115258871 [Aedes albopictus]XP_029735649.1 uncharacterized protein LOC115270331 [Aedes albopictus]
MPNSNGENDSVRSEEEQDYPEERLIDSDAEECGMELDDEVAVKAESDGVPAESTAPSDEDEPSLFIVSLIVSLRDFKGQTSAGELDTWMICANSVEEFLHSVWEQSKKHLVRHVVTVCDDDGNITYGWNPKKVIDEIDFVNFALFYDKQNRRTVSVDKLTTNILQNWRTKSAVELLLHRYSLTVNSKTVWKKVEKALIEIIPKNRGGAATTEYAQELANDLRRRHGHIWNGHDIAWSIWANAIITAPTHQHEAMKDEPTPPASCLDLFSMKESEQIRRIRREYRVAHNINDGYQAEVRKVVEAFAELKEAHQHQAVKITVLERHIENLALRSQIGESFISSAESALDVRENEFSAAIGSRVKDAEDVDHM